MKKQLDLMNSTVIKANELIQKSRFDLTLQQQKIVLYLISKVEPGDKEFKFYEFGIADFCRVCGIDYESGKNYHDLKEAVKEIADKSLWVNLGEHTETLVRWIEKPYIDKQSGLIRVKLDEDMKPFLLQLKQNFTQYELFWTMNFRSKYSVRLYELVKSLHYSGLGTYTAEFELDDLKRRLGAETYATYQTFKTRALTPAIAEVNKYSDKAVEFNPIKRGRSVAKIELTISTKPVEDRMVAMCAVEARLGIGGAADA